MGSAKDSKARGLILGLAAGDALGAPVEFLSRPRILERFGPNGIQAYPRGKGMFTDDTQMSVAVAEALIEAGDRPLDDLMAAVSRRFVEWLDSPDNFRSPGMTCKLACRSLKDGVPWTSSGIPGSKGCGSLMRTAPVGYYFRGDLARLREAAHWIGMSTHAHPTADAACIAGAYAVRLAMEDLPLADWPERIGAFTRGVSTDFDAAVARIIPALSIADEASALAGLGPKHTGWTAEEVFGMALFCVLKHPDDFRACILRAVNNSGDSDSIGCVAGAIQGARLGEAAIPRDWLDGLERRSDLEGLADRLAAAAGR